MLIKKDKIQCVSVEKPKGGEGLLMRWDCIKEQIPCVGLSSLSYVDLEPGSSIGKHQHVDNFEVYCFISGNGEVIDNDVQLPVSAGDVLVTGRGEHHGVINTGRAKLSFVAFICS